MSSAGAFRRRFRAADPAPTPGCSDVLRRRVAAKCTRRGDDRAFLGVSCAPRSGMTQQRNEDSSQYFDSAFMAAMYMKDATLQRTALSAHAPDPALFHRENRVHETDTLTLDTAADADVRGHRGQGPGARPAARPNATRSVVLGTNGMIATSQPMASAAGLKMLQDGGNAIDAAVTAAAVLAVVEPTMNGVAGDLFALLYTVSDGKLHALNSSGRSAYAATPEAFSSRGLREIPRTGVLSVSVPGVVDGWAELLARHGTISLASAAGDRLRATVTRVGHHRHRLGDWRGRAARPDAAAAFLPSGRPPVPGQLFKNRNLARTLERSAPPRAFWTNRPGHRGVDETEERPIEAREPITAPTGSARSTSCALRRLRTATEHAGRHARDAEYLGGYDLKALGHSSGRIHLDRGEAHRADRVLYRRPGIVPAATQQLFEDAAPPGKSSAPPATRAGGVSGQSAGCDASLLPVGRDHGDTIYMTVADGKKQHGVADQSLSTPSDQALSPAIPARASCRSNLFWPAPNRIAPHKQRFIPNPAFVMKGGKPDVGRMGVTCSRQATCRCSRP